MNENQTICFEKIKWIVAHNVLLGLPNFNREFKIHTNDINFQLGEFISQYGKTIDLCIGKLINSQMWFSVTEK